MVRPGRNRVKSHPTGSGWWPSIHRHIDHGRKARPSRSIYIKKRSVREATLVLLYFAERRVKDFHRGRHFFLGDDERRAEAQRALAATEQQQTFLKAFLH